MKKRKEKKAVTPSNKNIVFLWASAIRICHPLEVMLSRSLKKSWLWGAGVVVAQSHDEASSPPCSPSCFCQPVAFRTQAQKALWGSFCLTLSLLDNIQMLWFTRLTTKRNCVSFSYFREATWLYTYLLEVKWSMKKWLTYQSNLATASKWNKACWLDSNQSKDLWFFCLPSLSLFLVFLFFLWFLFSRFCPFGAFQLKESISHRF